LESHCTTKAASATNHRQIFRPALAVPQSLALDTLTINGANVTLTDIASTNGVLHAIDKVLTPTTH